MNIPAGMTSSAITSDGWRGGEGQQAERQQRGDDEVDAVERRPVGQRAVDEAAGGAAERPDASRMPAVAAAPLASPNAGSVTSQIPMPMPAGSDVSTSVRTPGDASAPRAPVRGRWGPGASRGSAGAR